MRTFLLLILITGCASTPKEKTLEWMGMGFTAGAIYGNSRPEYKTQSALMWGATLASLAAVAGLYTFDEHKEVETLRTETAQLKKQIDLVEGPQMISQGPGTLGFKIPEKYKNLIKPGEWKLFETDQWIDDGENRLIHQNLVMELIPPQLIPVTKVHE